MTRADPAAHLLRALAGLAGEAVALTHLSETPWSSATFVGGQHRIAVTGDIGWTAGLADADLPLRRCFVASVEVEPTPAGAVLTVLVLDD